MVIKKTFNILRSANGGVQTDAGFQRFYRKAFRDNDNVSLYLNTQGMSVLIDIFNFKKCSEIHIHFTT